MTFTFICRTDPIIIIVNAKDQFEAEEILKEIIGGKYVNFELVIK